MWTLKTYLKNTSGGTWMSRVSYHHINPISHQCFLVPGERTNVYCILDLRDNDFLPSRLSKLTGLKLLTSARSAPLSFWASRKCEKGLCSIITKFRYLKMFPYLKEPHPKKQSYKSYKVKYLHFGHLNLLANKLPQSINVLAINFLP